MTVTGYDPGLSIDSALKLPNEILLQDSISAAVSNADYISINIPYIKGENGTHGIIGKDIIEKFKSDAVILNFARGELVDSDAMKEFLDNGDGRYVSDFPDDLLWDHKNAVILPHLGASTEEAEDAAAAMAAIFIGPTGALSCVSFVGSPVSVFDSASAGVSVSFYTHVMIPLSSSPTSHCE